MTSNLYFTHGDFCVGVGESSISYWAHSLQARWFRHCLSGTILGHAGSVTFRDGLNSDPDILREFEKNAINMRPSDFVEQTLECNLEDSALTIVQRLVNNPTVGGLLINAHWRVRKLNSLSGSLILSDRPLIRVNGYDQPGAFWLLPLAPDAAFIACNDKSNLAWLMKQSDQRFIKELNRLSVGQSERFVFCIDQSHEKWIGRHLQGRVPVRVNYEPAGG